MRKAVALIWLAILLAAGGTAQAAVKTLTTASADCSTSTSCLVVTLPGGTSGASIALADGGSFSGTVQFEAIAGSPSTAGWVAINGYPPNSSTPATSATAAGTWKFSVSALQQIRVRFSTRNAGSIIVNINFSTGAAGMGSGGGGGPCVLSGSQTAGYVLTATDNATACDWETVGGASVDNNTIVNAWYIADGGSANTITGTTTTTFPGSYASGQAVIVKVKASNSGATTININSLGTKAVTKDGATALASGNLIANRDYLLIYDGTQFQAANYTKIAADFPTLNQNTSGTAANLSGTPALPNGTTGTTQALADNTTKLATDAFVIANAGGGGSVTPGAGSSGFTPGSVIIADGSGKLNEDNANLNYATGQLSVGSTGGSQGKLVISASTAGGYVDMQATNFISLVDIAAVPGATKESILSLDHNGGLGWNLASNDRGLGNDEFTLLEGTDGTYPIEAAQGTNGELLLKQSGGNVGIGVAPGATTAKLDVSGDANISGNITAANLSVIAPTFSTQTDGATVTWAVASSIWSNANLTFTVHSGSRTLNLTGLVNGGRYVIWLKQDGTGGEGLTLGSGCTWKVAGGGSGAVTLTNAANAVDVLSFTYDGTSCFAILNANFS